MFRHMEYIIVSWFALNSQFTNESSDVSKDFHKYLLKILCLKNILLTKLNWGIWKTFSLVLFFCTDSKSVLLIHLLLILLFPFPSRMVPFQFISVNLQYSILFFKTKIPFWIMVKSHYFVTCLTRAILWIAMFNNAQFALLRLKTEHVD